MSVAMQVTMHPLGMGVEGVGVRVGEGAIAVAAQTEVALMVSMQVPLLRSCAHEGSKSFDCLGCCLHV